MPDHPVDPVVDTGAAGALRRGTLAASVLDDIPLQPYPDGVLVGRSWDDRDAWTPVTWAALSDAVRGADPESFEGRLRLRDWLHAYLAVRELSDRGSTGHAPSAVVALALPRGHVLHPGPSWVVESVHGGVLDVGLGLRPDEPPAAAAGARAVAAAGVVALAVPLPPTAAQWADVDSARWWPAAREHRDAMAVLAGERLRHEGRGVLRPMGGLDVLTLLSGRWLRDDLARADGTGMRAVAAPMRSRAWFDLARIDPAFVGAAAAATEPQLRGVERPLLVTTDEVSVVTGRSSVVDVARSALAEPAARLPDHEHRDVLYH